MRGSTLLTSKLDFCDLDNLTICKVVTPLELKLHILEQ
jgi:hypothetical protein